MSKVSSGVLKLDNRTFSLVERTNEFLVLVTIKARAYLQNVRSHDMELSEDQDTMKMMDQFNLYTPPKAMSPDLN